jgi:restriction system protein
LSSERIPTYQQLMNRVLASAKYEPQKISAVVEEISRELNLSEEERARLLPSGKQTVIANRVHWARSYLKQAGLLRNPKRGWFELTDLGKQILDSGDTVDAKYLEKFEPFQEFKNRFNAAESDDKDEIETNHTDTPDEDIQEALRRRDRLLASELLETLRNVTPSFFEQVIVDLFVAMGMVALVHKPQEPSASRAIAEWTGLSTKMRWGSIKFTCRRSATTLTS